MKYLIVCLVLFAGFVNIACPKKDAIREAAKASYRLPGSTNDLIDRVREGVARGIFTPAEARKFGDLLEPIAKIEVVLVQAVKTAERIYRATGQIPAAELATINAKYDEIIDAFLDVLEFTGILDPNDRLFIETAVAAVRVFLRTIGIGFGFKASVQKLNAFADPRPPAPRKGKKGNGQPFKSTTAWLPGSIRPFSFNPQMRFA